MTTKKIDQVKPVALTEVDLDKVHGGITEGGLGKDGKASEYQVPVRRFVIDGKCTDSDE